MPGKETEIERFLVDQYVAFFGTDENIDNKACFIEYSRYLRTMTDFSDETIADILELIEKSAFFRSAKRVKSGFSGSEVPIGGIDVRE